MLEFKNDDVEEEEIRSEAVQRTMRMEQRHQLLQQLKGLKKRGQVEREMQQMQRSALSLPSAQKQLKKKQVTIDVPQSSTGASTATPMDETRAPAPNMQQPAENKESRPTTALEDLFRGPPESSPAGGGTRPDSPQSSPPPPPVPPQPSSPPDKTSNQKIAGAQAGHSSRNQTKTISEGANSQSADRSCPDIPRACTPFQRYFLLIVVHFSARRLALQLYK